MQKSETNQDTLVMRDGERNIYNIDAHAIHCYAKTAPNIYIYKNFVTFFFLFKFMSCKF